MAYTDYPNQADRFEVAANNLKIKVDNTITGLNSANRFLANDGNKDLVVVRTSETIVNVISRIEKMQNAIKSDIKEVHDIANDLEQEEIARRAAQARLKQLELEKQEKQVIIDA